MSASQFGQTSQPTSRQSDLEYDLQFIARHNAQQVEQAYDVETIAGLPSYQEPEPIGLDMNFNNHRLDTYPDPQFHEVYAQSNDPYGYSAVGMQGLTLNTPPTPRSNTTTDGTRSTRSGRALRRTDSPMSSDVRVSKSKPKPRSKKPTKVLPPEYQLDVPFSRIQRDWGAIPLKEVDKRANWSKQERERGTTKKDGRISRPMNAFLLYRSAWADRCKSYFNLSNHQYVSQILGASWAMESPEVKDHWKQLSTAESDNHKHHLPEYRYQPSKPTGKRDQDDFEVDKFGLEDDPDGEYTPSGRPARQPRKQPPRQAQYAPLDPYRQVSRYPVQLNQPQWEYGPSSQRQPIQYAQPHLYPGQAGQYHNVGSHHQWQASMEDTRLMNSTPAPAFSSGHELVALPGGHGHDMLNRSQTHTPLERYQQQQACRSFIDQDGVVYSQQPTDPGYGAGLDHESHFSEAIGDFGAPVATGSVLQDDWLDPTLNGNIQTDYSFALDEH